MKKRILSILMAALMVVGLLPDISLAAGETDESIQEVRYSTDNGTTWNESSLIDMPFQSGVYSAQNVKIELLRDIILTEENWTNNQQVLGGKANSEWTLDGNGYKITRGIKNTMMLSVNCTSSTVTLKNITIDGGANWDSEDVENRHNSGFSYNNNNNLLSVSNGATLVLDDGVILQNNYLKSESEPFYTYGAAVAVDLGSTLVMKDGAVIKDNYANSGGAIDIDATSVFNMKGGEIYGNYAIISGGAVSNEGIFNMSGGKIYNNASGNNGGAVTDNGSFTMSGGEIYNNKITGSMGGGILVYNGALSISGNPVVTGNVGKNNTDNNVYLNSGKTITVINPLDSSANIGITTAEVPKENTPVDVTGENGSDYSNCFKSDKEKQCSIVNAGNNKVQLTPIEYTITYHNVEGINIEGKIEKYMSGTGCSLPSGVTKKGYIFEGWYDNKNCTGKPLEKVSETDTGDKNFYAKWNLDAKKGIHYTISNGEWQNSDFIVTAADGYKISLSPDGDWQESLSASDDTADGKLSFYVMESATGIISKQVNEGYKIDKTPPTGEISIGENKWNTFTDDLTFDLFFNDKQQVSITSEDNISGIAKTEYYISDTVLTEQELKNLGDDIWIVLTEGSSVDIEPVDGSKFVCYVRMTDNAGNVAYLSSNGAEFDMTAPVITDIEDGEIYKGGGYYFYSFRCTS